MSKYLYILDDGHGKETLGKRSPKFPDGHRLFEYEYNIDLVDRIICRLKILSISCLDLVTTDRDESLYNRVTKANEYNSSLKKIYISVHGNGWGIDWNNANGIETYYYPGSRKGKKLAEIFQDRLIQYTGLKNRGVKNRGFYVLKYTNMSAILTENGFYTNYKECRKMELPEFRNMVADAHVRAIQDVEELGFI